jgi:putative FmdB family regulatory protein
MPLYEYECDACGHRFEVIQKFSDPPIEKCPACGSTVHKLQSAPAFQFKGTGWYVTDYANKGKGRSDEGKSESKSESKSETKGSDAKSDSGKSPGSGKDSKPTKKSA